MNNVLSFLGDTAPYIGAGFGFYYGWKHLKRVRYNMPNYPALRMTLTLGGPAFVGFAVPKSIHYIITSDTVKIIVVIIGGCYIVNMIEHDNKTEAQWNNDD
jgi:hypothetical protein